MRKIIFPIPILILFIIGTVTPIIPAWAQNNSNNYYTYRSTVLGTGIKHVNGFTYEILNQKSSFNVDDSVVVLTRIYKINQVDAFKIKHEIYWRNSSGSYRELYSPTYWPRGNWWAETYIWNDFGRLPEGDYELRVLLSINGGEYQHLDTKQFNVGGYYNYNNGYNNNNNNNYYYDQNYYNDQNNNNNYNANYYNDINTGNSYYSGDNYDYYNYRRTNYDYNWTNAGTSIRDIGNGDYEVVNGKLDFKYEEPVSVLTKLANIDGIQKLRIKQELYLYGNRYYRSNESPEQKIDNSYWRKYYFWTNFGKIPAGYHEVRIYISYNGGRYTEVDKKHISVGQVRDAYYNNRYDYRSDYRYDGTYMDNSVDHVSGYIYQVDNPKTEFTTNERVMVLTKVTNIRGIDSFRIKHELWRDGNSLERSLEAPMQYPRYNYWEYNYSWNDFGYVTAGNYHLRVLISINGSEYKYLDTKYITVTGQNNNVNYNYDWTKTGTNINNQNYQPNYNYGYQNYIDIRNFSFNPSTLTISNGSTVTWLNNDNTTHTVTSPGNFNSSNIMPGQSYSHTFNSTGTFNYYCNTHPYMSGTIIVQ